MRTVFFLLFLLSWGAVPLSFAKISRSDYEKALAFANQEQYDEAIEVLQASLKADPDQALIYNLLGMIYLRQNESVQSAIGSFQEAIRLDPNMAEAYFNLASTYAGGANRPDLAAVYFKKTLEVDPRYVKAYFGLGWFTLTAEEKPEEAAAYFQKAIHFFPDFAEAYYGLGLSHIQMGKSPLALQAVSQLRGLGREDLAAYLEAVLRGGKVSEMVPPEAVKADEPAKEVAPGTDPALTKKAAGPVGFKGNPPQEDSSLLDSFTASEPSEKDNPFQLN